ncbi:MAG: hypothetical protein A2020_00565 [Lentisphaerae bacterium GWF2_45_14]|nr:MAG: hypothetical protein A2020_00565 [Lentisphaerae bacterium GWF2_45_14]
MSYEYKSIYFDDPLISGRVLDIFEPGELSQDTALFFVHGGGWNAGSRTGYHVLMEEFRRRGFICASTDYRLVPGVDIFDQLTDIRHGYDIFTSFLKTKGRPLKIVTMGSSAGGHLAGLLSFAKPGECGEKTSLCGYMMQNEWIKPMGTALHAPALHFEPWEDIFPGILSAMEAGMKAPYAEAKGKYKAVSPIHYLSKDSCPAFVLVAGNEHMFPCWQAEEAVKTLKGFGIKAQYKVYKNAEHGFLYALDRWQQKEAFQDILDFIASIQV